MNTKIRVLASIVCLTMLAGLAACGNASTGTTGGNTSTGSSGTPASSGCQPGTQTINGVTTQQFCGSAKAQATVNGQTLIWTNGACFNSQGHIGVNLGRIILGTGTAADALKKQYDYLGAEAQATADGTYSGVVSAVYHGTEYDLGSAMLTVSHGGAQGSFTGTNLTDQAAVSGSWTC